jgi:hypothetical protein
MNYQKHYDALINRAKNRLLEGYCETHHIIPRCMGGKDDSDNLVDLTAEEHYVAHQLLIKIYPHNSKLLYAAKMMTMSSSDNVRNNKLYAWIRKKVSDSMKGQVPWNKGRTLPALSDEHKRKISESNTGRIFDDETRKKISETKKGKTTWIKGKTHSDETKRKIGKSNKGKVPWSKGKTFSDEYRKKISESLKLSELNKNRIPWNKGKRGQIPWNKGRTLPALSDEHKRKISETMKARIQQSKLHG